MYKPSRRSLKKMLCVLGSCCLILLPTREEEAEAQRSVCEWIDSQGELRLKPSQWEQTALLCSCDTLRSLKLIKSPLLKLPECFDSLHELRHLDMSKSALAAFPMEITRLEQLESLSLAHTRLAILPDEIADMPALKILDLRGTEVIDLPDGLQHLEVIDMRLIMLSKREQDELRTRHPNTQIFLSSPCNCH